MAVGGGSTCTSSNAAAVFKWAFEQGKRVFFLPDEHLGVNTAHDLDIPDEQILVYDPRKEQGGLTAPQLEQARVVVWKGFCIVHQAFAVEQMQLFRAKIPGVRLIVHPESPKEIVRFADAHGSTAQIIRYVEAAEPGTTILIGTELNLVQRLAELHAERGVTVKALTPSVCANMAKTTVANLADLLEKWPEENRVAVPNAIAQDARKSLERMLALS